MERQEASEARFGAFTDRDAALVRWRFGEGYVARLAAARYRAMLAGAHRVLDVGCGTGEAARFAEGAEYVGVDLSETLIRQGAGRPDRHLAAASLFALPFAEGTFDRVICMGVLHHLPPGHLAAALREMRRVLMPQGRLAIIEPNPWGLFQRLMAYVRPAERGILAVGPGAIGRAAREAGLEVEKALYDHTVFWAAHATFLLRRWPWVTGPRATALFETAHRVTTALVPPPLRSHTVWRLRPPPPAGAHR